MTGFSADWLALREALDATSRARVLTEKLAEFLTEAKSDEPLRVTDLACGTGSNLRYLAPALGGRQDWRLVDHDPALLAVIPERMKAWATDRGLEACAGGQVLNVRDVRFDCAVRVRSLDLATALDALDLPDAALVTASALLDLVSDAWLGDLARLCANAGAPVLFALTYDGRIEFQPAIADDELLRDAVNRHQRSDKGFGPALGPAATDAGRAAFEALGYRVAQAPSDWRLGRADWSLQEALVRGWFEAAVEIAPVERERLRRWLEEREALIRDGRSTLVVGHQDLLGLPPA